MHQTLSALKKFFSKMPQRRKLTLFLGIIVLLAVIGLFSWGVKTGRIRPFAATNASFTDVPTTSSIYPYVNKVWQAGLMMGCSSTKFCPDDQVTRAQVAVVLARALDYSYVTNNNPTFADVPANLAYNPHVEAVYKNAIMGPCDDYKFCPNDTATRAEMSRTLTNAANLDPITPATPTFSDVPATHPYFSYIEAVAKAGIFAGCAPGKFCPNDKFTRAQLAVVLTRTFLTNTWVGSIGGKVTLSDGNPAAGATIRIDPNSLTGVQKFTYGTSFITTSGADGTYTLSNIPTGTNLRLIVEKAGQGPRIFGIEVKKDQKVTQDIAMNKPTVALVGRFISKDTHTDGKNYPTSQGSVSIDPTSLSTNSYDTSKPYPFTAYTDPHGFFVINGLPVGAKVKLQWIFQTPPTGTKDVTLNASAGIQNLGNITINDSMNAANLNVTATLDTPQASFLVIDCQSGTKNIRFDASGKASIGSITPGFYQISVAKINNDGTTSQYKVPDQYVNTEITGGQTYNFNFSQMATQ